jgi:hypothetical protein
VIPDDDVTLIIQNLRHQNRTSQAPTSSREKMSRKEVKKRIREEMRADQPRYDEVTRLLKERIERGLRDMNQRAKRRESS